MSVIGSPIVMISGPSAGQSIEDDANGCGTSRLSNKRDLVSSCLNSTTTGPRSKVARYDLPIITAPSLHQECKSWVVFSDLHVKSDSIDTCKKVLHSVHQAALDRHGGVIFLGDFWHVRRTVEVELLNAVLDVLRHWTCPVIMIPGNHDQVTLGGTVHALTPLRSAFQLDQILIIDKPAICLGALWVPYRRERNVMRAVLRAGADAPGVSMIFCHADVKGAYMNDSLQSKEGLDIALFPKNIPIYSGHFHKPQTICKGGATLRYVGSPYQTSLAEAGQEKYFYCVQRGHHDVTVEGSICVEAPSVHGQTETWKEVERWVINIGRKIYRVSSPSDPSIAVAVSGDRVVVTVPTGQEHAAQLLRERLQERGIEVELRPEQPLTRRRNAAASDAADAVQVEDMDPQRIFRMYMSQLSSNPELKAALASSTTNNSSDSVGEVVNDYLDVKVLEEGLLTLQRLQYSTKAVGGTSGHANVLRFDTVTLSNFGPYFGDNAVIYPLSNRGLVLLKGQSTDGTGADSNGAGKTTLAMSVLWCLTGSLDSRIASDGKVTDVTFDSKSVIDKTVRKPSAAVGRKLTAQVVVKGEINSRPFEVIRRRCGAMGELDFTFDGKRLTCQAVKDTQMRIDDHLGIKGGLLQRCCFFGQHAMQVLLGLTDLKLKQELSALVDTSLWVTAVKDVRSRESATQSQLAELSAQCKLLKTNLHRADASYVSASDKLLSLEQDLALATEALDAIPIIAVSIADLNQNLAALKNERDLFSENTYKPLQTAGLTAKAECDVACAEIDARLGQMRVDAAKLETEMVGTNRTIEDLKKRKQTLQIDSDFLYGQMKGLQLEIDTIVQSTVSEVTVLNANAAVLRQLHEQSVEECSVVNINTTAAETALKRLNGLQTAHPCAKDEACPTCGQEMPLESRVERMAQLTALLERLRKEKAALSERSSSLSNLCRCSASMDAINAKRSDLHKQMEEVSVAMEKHEIALGELSQSFEAHGRKRAQTELEKVALLETFAQHLNENKQALGAADARLAELRVRECDLQERIEASHQQAEKRQQAHSRVAIHQERVSNARGDLQEKDREQGRIQKEISTNNTSREQLTAQSVLLKRLVSVFGQREIQNYVFQNVIKQLEDITNTYLRALAEGGIQLTLEGAGEDESRIVKSVWVRSRESDGELRERSLAQLSGGQWRRVSLAFDFAFAELIRRRGVLRSNLMVMDEVLTHLDASGREAVGAVLRGMVQAPNADDEMDIQEEGVEVCDEDVDQCDAAQPSAEERRMQRLNMGALMGGGAYETVIVILQDLAAAELSEAFDHVDVVVKQSDKSTVELDGEET